VIRTSALLAVIVAGGLVVTSCASASDVREAASVSSSVTPSASESPTGPTEPTPTVVTTPPTSATATEPSTSAPPSSSAPTETPAVPPKPRPGSCYATSRASFRHQVDGSAPVSCRSMHTAETFAVFPTDGSLSSSQIATVWRDCQARFRNYVGASATVSTIGLTLILPSSDETAAGQHWIRCDAILLANYNAAGTNGKIGLPHVGSLAGALFNGVPDRYRGCARHWPKVDQPVHFTSCAQFHQAELIPESLTLGGPDAPYPGKQSSINSSKTFCGNVFQNYVPETDHYYYYYPTAASWRSSTHDTTCWALDTNGDGLPPI
jgi:Septum formation